MNSEVEVERGVAIGMSKKFDQPNQTTKNWRNLKEVKNNRWKEKNKLMKVEKEDIIFNLKTKLLPFLKCRDQIITL